MNKYRYIETAAGETLIGTDDGLAAAKRVVLDAPITHEIAVPSKVDIDALGATLKEVEARYASVAVLDRERWTVARLDVRAGRSVTRGMSRPYDATFGDSMLETARGLVTSRHATTAYVQSDEITLVWPPLEGDATMMFGGRTTKWLSTLAGEASARLALALAARGVTRPTPPHLDCRIFQGDQSTAAHSLGWRAADAFRNAIQSAGQAWIGRKRIHGWGTVRVLRAVIGDPAIRPRWLNLPDHARFGTALKRVRVTRPLAAAERDGIPESHRPAPGAEVTRTDVVEVPFDDIFR